MPAPDDHHYSLVARRIVEGRVVPLLGAGVNLCGRPAGEEWKERGSYLPSGSELSKHLARQFAYPDADVADLVRVSQYVSVMVGSAPLYESLRELFDADFQPTAVHTFLAGLGATYQRRGWVPRRQLVVTTNYDESLERAFAAAGEPIDRVWYVADGPNRGKFLHAPPDGEPRVIEKPNEYTELSLDRRSVVLKIHGAIDRANVERDSYVITEDHYIDYLTHTDLSNLVPVVLAAKLRRSHFLFLGYGLRDWNLRVILHRIWGEQPLSFKSWAVQRASSPVETEFWRKRGVEIFDAPLEDYIAGVERAIEALEPDAGRE